MFRKSGFSMFGDRLPDKDGPQTTCYIKGVENPATPAGVTSFLANNFTEVDDGKDAAESSVDTSMYLLAHKYPPSNVEELRILVIITDAPGKTEGEGVSASTEGIKELVDPSACVTCDNAYKLPKRDLFIEMLIKMDVSPIILTTSTGSKKKKSNAGVIIGAIIGALICLALIGAAVWYFTSSKGGGGGAKPAPRSSLANAPDEEGDEEEEDEEEEENDEDEEEEEDEEEDDEEEEEV